ncbi:MAG: NUDIX domain-containing protein [Brevundimonas sp.]|uniref:NUDIX domain-containing protein n=1 Tax=Brevundimonas sp. TaxID=1871086 RepID=UPI0025C3FB8A|nr:NUDIX domain-containing protein [Brevundimonas sp.]MBX3477712.1 NUDIX domain-containing protein [Brevundimonas sp.]
MDPQFGPPDPHDSYRLRPAVFGLALRDGRLACVRVDRGEAGYFDLPGGAIDGAETEPQALAREFAEETGLRIVATHRLGQAGQRFRKSDGTAVNNVGGFWRVDILGQNPDAKCEDDHTLTWLDPDEALAALRHEAHAWAVTLLLRSER